MEKKCATQLIDWLSVSKRFCLPHCEELSDFGAYMDQVKTLVDRHLSPVIHEKNILC